MPLLILFLAVSVFAQGTAPDWLDESSRAARYPKAEWHTGFATDRIMNGQPDSRAYEAVEKSAQNKLAESIVVTVNASSALQTTVRQEAASTSYDQSITTASNAVLAKVDVKSYFDKKSGYIYGFAAVRKKDLAEFYSGKINALLSFAEKEFILAGQMAEQGRKKAALGRIQAMEDSLKSAGYWGSLLQIVGSDNSYMKREQEFWQRAGDMKMRLLNGTSVYLDISGDNALETLGAEMQEKGCNCSIAEARDEADYLVAVKSKLGECSEAGNGLVFCHANATVTVSSPRHGKPASVKIPEAKGGAPNNNRDKATAEAFRKLTGSLAEKINQAINQ